MMAPKIQRYWNVHLRRMKRNLSTFTLQQNIRKPDASWFAWYSRQLDERPVFTKSITATFLSSTGNILAQYLKYYNDQEKAKKEAAETGDLTVTSDKEFVIAYDQVGRFAFLNAILVAPVLHHWYGFINRTVPGTTMSRVLQRTFLDEFIFSPVFIPVFLGSLWTLEGTSIKDMKTMLYNQLPSILIAEWVLWVPTMIITFRYAPVKFQVLVINCVGVVWQTFLSFMANDAHGNKETEPKAGHTYGFLTTVAGIAEIHLEDIFDKIETW
jgi:peroxisomal membrane protein 2